MADDSIENWLEVELNHAKYTPNLWGRALLQAIDQDDCIALYECSKRDGFDINTQITILGYAQYLWTCQFHKFLGDTALHLAIRQKKIMCVHMLLLLKARTDIPNAAGITGNDLCLSFFGTSAKNLQYEAHKFILHRTNLKDIPKLPDSVRYRNIEKEAWKLMEQGRILYSELPKSFAGEDAILTKHLANLRKSHLSFNLPKKPKPETVKDNVKREEPPPVIVSTPVVPAEWVILLDPESGKEYFYEKISGQSSWEQPPGYIPPVTPAENMNTTSSKPGSPNAKPSGANATKPAANNNNKSSNKPGTPSKSPLKGRGASASPSKAPTKSTALSGKKGAIHKVQAESDEDSADSGSKSSANSSVSTFTKARRIASAKEPKKNDKEAENAQGSPARKRMIRRDEKRPIKASEPVIVRTLREQYQDSGAVMSERAELEALREDIQLLEKSLHDIAQAVQLGPGVSVPPLPEDYAAVVFEKERKLRDLQVDLLAKSRAYYNISVPGKVSPTRRTNRKQPTPQPTMSPKKVSVKTGVAAAPAAAKATGDVWGRDNLCDVIYLIERQKTLRLEKIAQRAQPVAKGLRLLDSVKISNPVDRVIAHEENLFVGRGDTQYVPENVQNLQGVKKLKFLNMRKLESQSSAAQSGGVNKKTQSATPSTRLSRFVSDRILYPHDAYLSPHEEDNHSYESSSLGGGRGDPASLGMSKASSITQRRYALPTEPTYDALREITRFSTQTNMKYMKIGDEGAEQLALALQHDEIVTNLCLSGARITSVGMSLFAKHLPDMKSLRHLDLANNAICDSGAIALAAALPYCVLLEQCNLLGNRVTVVGAVRLIQAVFVSPLHWLCLKNNHIGGDDDQVVMKVLEEHNYISEHNDHVFELSSAVSAGMTMMHMDEEHSAKTSIMEVQHTRQKMFVF